MPKSRTLSEEDEELYELSENLRLQLVVLELQNKIVKYGYHKDKAIISKRYIILHTLKIILISIYSIFVFSEKPLHCYKSTTFYTNVNKFDNECDPNLQYLNSDLFMPEKLYRSLELIFLISLACVKFLHYKLKNINLLKKINNYIILQYVILGIISLCIIDIIMGLIFESFPLINFFFRGVLLILFIKTQRNMWEIVIKIFYRTRILTFLIFCVMLFFGIVGHFLFSEKSEDFGSILKSTYSLFILLSTCNFPDVMLATFYDTNKLAFFYFLLYLVINYFILFTLLQTLYYSEFFESFKANVRNAIEGIFEEFHDKKNFKKKKKSLKKNMNYDINNNDNNDNNINYNNNINNINNSNINNSDNNNDNNSINNINNSINDNNNNDNNNNDNNNSNHDMSINISNSNKRKSISSNDDEDNLDNGMFNDPNSKNNYLIPEKSKRFNKVLFNLNKQFYLTKNDYLKILKLIGYKGDISDFTKNDIYQLLNEADDNQRKAIDFIKSSSIFLKFFSNKYTEIIINILNFVLMMILLVEFEDKTKDFYFTLIPQSIWSFLFIFEFIIYKGHFTFLHLMENELVLISFFIINCLILIGFLLVFLFERFDNEYVAKIFMIIVKIFISLRMIRVFILFKKYNTFETFSKTFHNMKKIFYGLFTALFSFFYLFITITMFLTGGNILQNSFKGNESIPDSYANINFNDFGSGFLTCFCLTMINNINIISISLSYGHSKYYQGYFTLFYFISTLVILNISTTLLLEMYTSIQSKMREVRNKGGDDEEMTVGGAME